MNPYEKQTIRYHNEDYINWIWMNPLLVIDHLADILTLEEIEIIRKPQSTSQERIGVLIGILYEKNEKYRPFERFIKALEETDENHKRMAKSIMNIYNNKSQKTIWITCANNLCELLDGGKTRVHLACVGYSSETDKERPWFCNGSCALEYYDESNRHPFHWEWLEDYANLENAWSSYHAYIFAKSFIFENFLDESRILVALRVVLTPPVLSVGTANCAGFFSLRKKNWNLLFELDLDILVFTETKIKYDGINPVAVKGDCDQIKIDASIDFECRSMKDQMKTLGGRQHFFKHKFARNKCDPKLDWKPSFSIDYDWYPLFTDNGGLCIYAKRALNVEHLQSKRTADLFDYVLIYLKTLQTYVCGVYRNYKKMEPSQFMNFIKVVEQRITEHQSLLIKKSKIHPKTREDTIDLPFPRLIMTGDFNFDYWVFRESVNFETEIANGECILNIQQIVRPNTNGAAPFFGNQNFLAKKLPEDISTRTKKEYYGKKPDNPVVTLIANFNANIFDEFACSLNDNQLRYLAIEPNFAQGFLAGFARANELAGACIDHIYVPVPSKQEADNFYDHMECNFHGIHENRKGGHNVVIAKLLLKEIDNKEENATPTVARMIRDLKKNLHDIYIKLCKQKKSTLQNSSNIDEPVVLQYETEDGTVVTMELSEHDLATLNGKGWLNEAIIDKYFSLIDARSDVQNLPLRCHSFTTKFCYQHFVQSQSEVEISTNDMDIFSKDLLFFPLHVNENHWALTAVYIAQKKISFLDSTGNNGDEYLERVREFLNSLLSNCTERDKEQIDFASFQLFNEKNLSQRSDECDCGVYICCYAEQLSRAVPNSFSHTDITAFLLQMRRELEENQLSEMN